MLFVTPSEFIALSATSHLTFLRCALCFSVELFTLNHNAAITGVATVGQDLFVLSDESDIIHIYNTSRPDNVVARTVTVPGIRNGWDMASCHESVYIIDSTVARLFRLDRDGQLTASWPLPHQPVGLSVNASSCSITVLYATGYGIQEFTETGRPGPIVQFNLIHQMDAVRVGDGRYVIRHGRMEGRVALVNDSGHLLESDTGYRESGSVPLLRPYHMLVSEKGFVLVVDNYLHRVVLLDPTLRYIRDLVSADHGLTWPRRIWLEEGRGQLFVVYSQSAGNVRAFTLK